MAGNAFTAITDIINPEVLADQISAKFPDMLVLGNSNFVEVDTTFPLGSPGTEFKLPFWKKIGTFGDLTEGTAMETGKITSGSEYCTVVRGGAAFACYDTSELVSKSDPTGEIAGQLARRAAEYIDAKLVAQLELSPNTFDNITGVLGSWSAGAQTLSLGATNEANTLDQNAIFRALLSLGDNSGVVRSSGGIIMHSKVFADLQQTGAIQNQYQSGMNVIASGNIPSIGGLPIQVSDRVTVVSSTPNKYKTYILGPKALALFYQRQVQVEFDRDILLQADVIAATTHFAPHLFGYDDKTTAYVAESGKSTPAVVITSK